MMVENKLDSDNILKDDIPSNKSDAFTREHVLEAIKRLDNDGWPPNRHCQICSSL